VGARAFKGLFTADGLKDARKRVGQGPAWSTDTPAKTTFALTYQRAGAGCKPARAVFLRTVWRDPLTCAVPGRDLRQTLGEWLEDKLGSLAGLLARMLGTTPRFAEHACTVVRQQLYSGVGTCPLA
jgi:hypothetical protein